jgi:hypothetical protein
MAKKAKVVLPVAPLPDLVEWWESQRVPGLVIGGLAVALLGRPRVTRDIDAPVLPPEERRGRSWTPKDLIITKGG